MGTQTVTYTEVLGPNTITIVAVDQAGNASAPSNAMTVDTNWAWRVRPAVRIRPAVARWSTDR